MEQDSGQTTFAQDAPAASISDSTGTTKFEAYNQNGCIPAFRTDEGPNVDLCNCRRILQARKSLSVEKVAGLGDDCLVDLCLLPGSDAQNASPPPPTCLAVLTDYDFISIS